MDLGFKDRIALVTGSGGGIGRVIALALAKEGAAVAINDIDEAGITETVRLVEAEGGHAVPARYDITDLESTRSMALTIERALGRIDVLVNNAALLLNHDLFP